MSKAENRFINAWLVIGPIVFGIVGLLSLVTVDVVFLPRIPGTKEALIERLDFSKELMFILSCTISPIVCSFITAYLWLKKGNRGFNWFIIAVISYGSIMVNPVMWFLTIITFFLYPLVAGFLFVIAGGSVCLLWFLSKQCLTSRSS